ncbi:MAG: hypothetical protein P8X68_13440 [Desulfobacterales bacterium]|jgi:hypothetical protein
MSDKIGLLWGIFALIIVFILTRKYHAWRLKKAYLFIIKDLKEKGAYSADSAVKLPYAEKNILRIGLRQHHPQVLNQLILENIVARTEDKRYYLTQHNIS